MLNFEDEMKAVRKGYVVLDIDEYNRLRDEIAAANMRAYEAEQLASRRIAEAAANNQSIIDSLISVEQATFNGPGIDIRFNARAIRALALNIMSRHFSAEELAEYDIKSADDMLILDERIAVRKPVDITNEE